MKSPSAEVQKASRSSGSASDKGSGGLQLALCSGSLRRNRAARRDPSFSSTSSSYSTRLHVYHDVELLFLKSNLYGSTLGSGEGGLAQRLPDPEAARAVLFSGRKKAPRPAPAQPTHPCRWQPSSTLGESSELWQSLNLALHEQRGPVSLH